MKKEYKIQTCHPHSMYIDYQPGNATRYEVYLTPTFENSDVFVVSIPNLNMCFCVNSLSTLTWEYIYEKVGVGGRRANECDASAITALLSEVFKNPARVHTDDEGRWCNEERWINEDKRQDQG
jgi:hypothetical protein